MDTNEVAAKVAYWDELSRYDLDTAKVMLDGARYLYVGFMCHQAVEKALKAYCWHSSRLEPKYTHSLSLGSECRDPDGVERGPVSLVGYPRTM